MRHIAVIVVKVASREKQKEHLILTFREIHFWGNKQKIKAILEPTWMRIPNKGLIQDNLNIFLPISGASNVSKSWFTFFIQTIVLVSFIGYFNQSWDFTQRPK